VSHGHDSEEIGERGFREMQKMMKMFSKGKMPRGMGALMGGRR
jgi:hypothetical protein